jgi:hypothetical protein
MNREAGADRQDDRTQRGNHGAAGVRMACADAAEGGSSFRMRE